MFYKFSSTYCYYHIPQILIDFIFVFIYFLMLSNFSWDFTYNLEMHCFIFSYFLLIFNLVPYWSKKKMLHDFYFIKFVKINFMTKMWLILVNVLCKIEKNVYSSKIGWSFPWISIWSSWLIVLLRSTISLLIFCLLDPTWSINS